MSAERLSRGVLRIVDLYSHSERREGSTCWWWLGAMEGSRARIWTVCHDQVTKRVMNGSRAVWNIAHGRGPGTGLAYMRCMNKACVNPQHAALAESRVAMGKVTAAAGSMRGKHHAQRRASAAAGWAAQGMTVTPPEVVRAVRLATGNNLQIAKQCGCSHQVVSRILRGESHRQVGLELAEAA